MRANSTTLQYQLARVFERDWNSQYAMDVRDYLKILSNDHSWSVLNLNTHVMYAVNKCTHNDSMFHKQHVILLQWTKVYIRNSLHWHIYIYIACWAVGVARWVSYFQPIQLPIQLVHESKPSEADCEGCDCGEGGDSSEGVFSFEVASWKGKAIISVVRGHLQNSQPNPSYTVLRFVKCVLNGIAWKRGYTSNVLSYSSTYM